MSNRTIRISSDFFMLPLIFPNGYEIKLLKPSTSYTIVGGREIPFYAEPEAVYKETTESYESAELACLKKLIEIVNKYRNGKDFAKIAQELLNQTK